MSKKEQDELKKKEEGAGDTGAGADDSANKKGKKMIEVSEETLRELVKELKDTKLVVEELSKNAVATGPNGIQVRRKTKEFDYTLRVWENKIVVGMQNMGSEERPLYVMDVYDEKARKQVQFVNLLLDGEEKPVKVDYITFLRDAQRLKARKISQVEHEETQEYGMIPKKEMTENGYGMFETMVMVPVEVITKTYTVKLKLPDEFKGREIDVNSKWLNM